MMDVPSMFALCSEHGGPARVYPWFDVRAPLGRLVCVQCRGFLEAARDARKAL